MIPGLTTPAQTKIKTKKKESGRGSVRRSETAGGGTKNIGKKKVSSKVQWPPVNRDSDNDNRDFRPL